MKKTHLKSYLTGCLLLISMIAFSQDIAFSYDAAGNRTSRIVINKEIKTTLADSILPEASYKQVNLDLSTLNISIYPNPATDEIHIECIEAEEDNNAKAFLFSSNGTLLTSFTINEPAETFHMENYSPGIYYLKVRFNSIVESWKIVKN
ncbi:MAG: T9SS type A sorting domain-containing protein [Bacteroidales bacterium]|nr:T9SS type A sorting domain-containing protein [Bacteroidales bacterium]